MEGARVCDASQIPLTPQTSDPPRQQPIKTRRLAAKSSRALRGAAPSSVRCPAARGPPRGLDEFRQSLAEMFQGTNRPGKRDAGGSITAAEIDAFGINPCCLPWPIGLAHKHGRKLRERIAMMPVQFG